MFVHIAYGRPSQADRIRAGVGLRELQAGISGICLRDQTIEEPQALLFDEPSQQDMIGMLERSDHGIDFFPSPDRHPELALGFMEC